MALGWRHAALAAGLAALLTGCADRGAAGAAAGRYASAGERIYFSGLDRRGRPLPFTGGTLAQRLRGGGCAGCHGADRRGGARMWPRFWVVAPPITPPALYAPVPGRPRYDPRTLRRAIRDGVAADGRRLDPAMPRWSLTPLELSETVYYLSF